MIKIKKLILAVGLILSCLFVSVAQADSCNPHFQGLDFNGALIAINVGGYAMQCLYHGHAYYAAPNAKPILPGKWISIGGGQYSCTSTSVLDCQYQRVA